MALISVPETTAKLVAARDPNVTPVAPVKPEPVMVIVVFPNVDRQAGATMAIEGLQT